MPENFCKLLEEAIKDEAEAPKMYKKLAETFRESDNPTIRAMAILAEKIAQDEEGHKTALTKVYRLACSTK